MSEFTFRPATEADLAKPRASTRWVALLVAVHAAPQVVEYEGTEKDAQSLRSKVSSVSRRRGMKVSIRKIDPTHYLVFEVAP